MVDLVFKHPELLIIAFIIFALLFVVIKEFIIPLFKKESGINGKI